MYVRLAFSVAAHLEADILLVDEVLAVGDIRFQQKCLGKMQDVARQEGRTVLFVSHNMAAVSRLCSRAIWLDAGKVSNAGNAGSIVASYLQQATATVHRWHRPADEKISGVMSFTEVAVVSDEGVLAYSEPITLAIKCEERATTAPWLVCVSVFDAAGNEVVASWDIDSLSARAPHPFRTLHLNCRFPGRLLRPGRYTVTVSACEMAGGQPMQLLDLRQSVVYFEISPQGYSRRTDRGITGPQVDWWESNFNAKH
jgi:lipopolysaccharide transport system ATP-binding protein